MHSQLTTSQRQVMDHQLIPNLHIAHTHMCGPRQSKEHIFKQSTQKHQEHTNQDSTIRKTMEHMPSQLN